MTSDDLARRTAQRLGSELDPRLPALVETQLRGGDRPPENYDLSTTLALASLLVSIAQLAWSIYESQREANVPVNNSNNLSRKLRLEVKTESNISPEQRDRIISIVVEEINK